VWKILGYDCRRTTANYPNVTDAHVCDEFERMW
jgi:hypothetical protein